MTDEKKSRPSMLVSSGMPKPFLVIFKAHRQKVAVGQHRKMRPFGTAKLLGAADLCGTLRALAGTCRRVDFERV
jgi:hypothetical protein